MTDSAREIDIKLKLLSSYKTIFPQCRLDDEGMAMYIMLLSDISVNELKTAMFRLSEKSNFFPTVAEIKKQVKEIRDLLYPKSHVKTADEAWSEVLDQMKIAFPYKAPVFSSKEIRDTVNTLGWMNICETSTDKVGITRAQFRDTYNAIIQRKTDREENMRIIASIPKSIKGTSLQRLLLPSRDSEDNSDW